MTDRNRPTEPPFMREKRPSSEELARRVGMTSTAGFPAVAPPAPPLEFPNSEDESSEQETTSIPAALDRPIPILLHCPLCHHRHIDEGIYKTKPHHTHACQFCGHVWRPAIVATVGVLYLPGFKDR